MNREVLLWLQKAREDLQVARHELALPDEEVVTTAVCFHCQQFVEKVFKAFLVLHQSDFPRTHNVEYLRELCAQIDAEFHHLQLGNLHFYAVEIRYPSDFPTLTLREASECLAIAEKIREFIDRKLSISIDNLGL
ncbi:MAG: HEPN domain-containing protein [Fimbriimonadales bacterium]